MNKIQEITNKICWERAEKREVVCKALVGIGINLKNCYFDQDDNLIIPCSEIYRNKSNIWCRIGWHKVRRIIGFEGVSVHGICSRCGKECMQDSQGGWF